MRRIQQLVLFTSAGVAGLALSPAAPARAAEPLTWELRQGRFWEQLPPGAATQPAADETLDRIQQLVENRQAALAKKLAVYWLRTHKNSPLRDRGLYLLGEANYRYGDRIQSFYNFDELLDRYIDSKYFYPALKRQYDIADAYLRGYKRRFFGAPLFGATDEAVEMLFRIQQRSPGSPLAEQSLLRTADYFYKTSQFDLAVDAYGAFARDYARSPEVPRARLRQAFANLAQFRGLKFDASPLTDAREQLSEVAALYPDLASEENLTSIVDRIDSTFARKIFVTAGFYVKTQQLRAAVYNYRYLVKAYPTSPQADLARRQLAKMPKAALEGAEPPEGKGYGPATQPSASAR